MPFVVGETVGQYRILEKLGRGGMATVFKAYHPALDRYVALKALHPAFMEDPNFLARFQREARVVARLEHPNIVPIYDFAEHEGRPYLVMKFIEGETLKARLKRAPIGKDDLIHIAESVGEGLHYAHQKGILHRDVKPSNVLLGFDKRVYLADFGLARIAQAGESTLSSDMMLGTPQYISPEQAMGVKELTEGTDIYSFGVVLYELIVGQVPFSADTPFSIIHDHIYTPLPLPRQIRSDIPDEVERVLLKSLAKERADRYPDAIALVEAFKAAIQEEATSAPPVDDLPEEGTDSGERAPFAETPILTSLDAPPEDAEVADGAEPEELGESEMAIPAPEEESAPEEKVATLEDEKKKSGRRWKWWQIVLAVLALMFCCLLGLAAISRIQENRQAAQSTQTEADSGTIEGLQDADIPEAVQEAYKNTEKNPDDPFAFIDLAGALLDCDRQDEATEAFRKAFVMAEGDQAVVIRGIDMMAERGLWVGITSSLLVYHRNHPENFDDEIYNRFSEAAYIATEFPAAEEAIPIDKIAEVDEVFERVIKARYVLLQDDPESAQAILDVVLSEMRPDMPEALLVQAEVNLKIGDQPNARKILTELETRDDVPDWVRAHTGALWTKVEADVDASQEKVDENPDDAWAHLDLLDASLTAGNHAEAENQINFILENAGEDAQLYYSTGEILIKHGAWQYAVAFYDISAELMDQPSEEVINRIHMSAYFSGLMEDGYEVISNPDINLPEDLLQVVKARHELYFGDYDIAAEAIQTLLESDPLLDEEILLEAERLIAIEQYSEAKTLLTRLQEDETKPFWIREEARNLLERLD